MQNRPEPRSATTPEEFLDALRQLRAWAGQPSLRTLNALAGADPNPASGSRSTSALPVSTLSDNLSGKRLPRLPFVTAFVTACMHAGGEHSDEAIAIETERWNEAWHALAEPDALRPVPAPATLSLDEQPAPSEDRPARHRLQAPSRKRRKRLPLLAWTIGMVTGAALVWLVLPNDASPSRRTPPEAGSADGAPSSSPPFSTNPTRSPSRSETPQPEPGPTQPSTRVGAGSTPKPRSGTEPKREPSTPAKKTPAPTPATTSPNPYYNPDWTKYASPGFYLRFGPPTQSP
ncbi:hypothetical protein [Spirillospora sp. NPDC047279]|uniref:hypothetical protein n=1 Tax=Spirillospora sp. NPDC047279 TaxID=3155478 RepID=UPI0033EB7572